MPSSAKLAWVNFLAAPIGIFLAVGVVRWLFLRVKDHSDVPAWLALAPLWWSHPGITTMARGRKLVVLGAETVLTYLVVVGTTIAIQTTSGMPTGTIFYRVMDVAPGAAADGLLEPGDVITHVGGHDAAMVRQGIHGAALIDLFQSPEAIEVRFLRNGQVEKEMISPRFVSDSQLYLIGIALEFHDEQDHAIRLRQALVLPISALHAKIAQVREVVDMVVGHQEGELSGPVGISTIAQRRSPSNAGLIRGLLLAALGVWILGAGNVFCALLSPYDRARR